MVINNRARLSPRGQRWTCAPNTHTPHLYTHYPLSSPTHTPRHTQAPCLQLYSAAYPQKHTPTCTRRQAGPAHTGTHVCTHTALPRTSTPSPGPAAPVSTPRLPNLRWASCHLGEPSHTEPDQTRTPGSQRAADSPHSYLWQLWPREGKGMVKPHSLSSSK